MTKENNTVDSTVDRSLSNHQIHTLHIKAKNTVAISTWLTHSKSQFNHFLLFVIHLWPKYPEEWTILPSWTCVREWSWKSSSALQRISQCEDKSLNRPVSQSLIRMTVLLPHSCYSPLGANWEEEEGRGRWWASIDLESSQMKQALFKTSFKNIFFF